MIFRRVQNTFQAAQKLSNSKVDSGEFVMLSKFQRLAKKCCFFALISYKPPIAKWIADMGGKIKDKSPRGKSPYLSLVTYLICTLESFSNSKLNDVLYALLISSFRWVQAYYFFVWSASKF